MRRPHPQTVRAIAATGAPVLPRAISWRAVPDGDSGRTTGYHRRHDPRHLRRSFAAERPASGALAYDAALGLAGSLLIALSAQLALPLPFSPVPISAQTLAVLLTGALLGSRCGALSALVYLGEGLAGLPVFAGGATARRISPDPRAATSPVSSPRPT